MKCDAVPLFPSALSAEQHSITFHAWDCGAHSVDRDNTLLLTCIKPHLLFFCFFFIYIEKMNLILFIWSLFLKDQQICVFNLGYTGAFSSVCRTLSKAPKLLVNRPGGVLATRCVFSCGLLVGKHWVIFNSKSVFSIKQVFLDYWRKTKS